MGIVQHPATVARRSTDWLPLKAYVVGIVGAFADDQRVLAWDVWNEPDNAYASSHKELPNKVAPVAALLPQVFEWARCVNPSQPLTSGVWEGKPAEWSDPTKWSPVQRTQLQESDVISFHNYSWPEDFEAHVTALQGLQRPILCTEYMARSVGSTFDTILPIAKRYKVSAINWGLVAGKTQTIYPWESWQHPYVQTQPPVWFHNIFKADGTPYRERETQLIRELTSESNQQKAQASR